VERFNLKKLNEVEGKEKYRVEGLQHWKIWMLRLKLILSGKQLENIKISAKESLGYYELKKHEP
jgi:hypothetical protein